MFWLVTFRQLSWLPISHDDFGLRATFRILLEISRNATMEESGDPQALRKLVQKATNQNEERLDAAQAKQIRDFAKRSEDNVRLVQELLMDRLKWPHAEVRLMLCLDLVWQLLLEGLRDCQRSLREALLCLTSARERHPLACRRACMCWSCATS